MLILLSLIKCKSLDKTTHDLYLQKVDSGKCHGRLFKSAKNLLTSTFNTNSIKLKNLERLALIRLYATAVIANSTLWSSDYLAFVMK